MIIIWYTIDNIEYTHRPYTTRSLGNESWRAAKDKGHSSVTMLPTHIKLWRKPYGSAGNTVWRIECSYINNYYCILSSRRPTSLRDVLSLFLCCNIVVGKHKSQKHNYLSMSNVHVCYASPNIIMI